MFKKNKVKQQDIKSSKQLANEEKAAKHQQWKNTKQADKKALKATIKAQKTALKTLSKEHRKTVKTGRSEHRGNKPELHKYLQTVRDEYYDSVIAVKNQIAQLKYDFGIKYNTLNWKLFRWMFGIKKEFYRVIWSDPSNTFKYLAIIVIVVAVLSLVCFGIDLIVNQYIN